MSEEKNQKQEEFLNSYEERAREFRSNAKLQKWLGIINFCIFVFLGVSGDTTGFNIMFFFTLFNLFAYVMNNKIALKYETFVQEYRDENHRRKIVSQLNPHKNDTDTID